MKYKDLFHWIKNDQIKLKCQICSVYSIYFQLIN